jgi:threonine synthase
VYRSRDGYLLDPHTAVAMAAADRLSNNFAADTKVVCLATAHPAKFPDVIRKALAVDHKLPEAAMHKSIEAAKDLCRHVRLCDCDKLAPALTRALQSVTKFRTTLSRLG